jgi:hypothetical protein
MPIIGFTGITGQSELSATLTPFFIRVAIDINAPNLFLEQSLYIGLHYHK